MMEKIIKDYKENVVIDRVHPIGAGKQVVLNFDNGYGASLVQFPGSYGGESGLYEIAVIKFKNGDLDNYELTYDTPVTDDVLGYLDEAECIKTFEEIKALPAKKE
jgi:hypothetical protein